MQLAPALLATAIALQLPTPAAREGLAWEEAERYFQLQELAHGALASGDLRGARGALTDAFAWLDGRGLESPAPLRYLQACVAARSEDPSGALEQLLEAVRAGYAEPDLLRWDPDLESIRAAAPFAEILRLADAPWQTELAPAVTLGTVATEPRPHFLDATWLNEGHAAIADSSGGVHVLSVASGDLVASASGERRTTRLVALAQNPAAATLGFLSASNDGAVRRWEYDPLSAGLRSAERLQVAPEPEPGKVRTFEPFERSPSGALCFTVVSGQVVVLNGQLEALSTVPATGPAAWTPDGERICMAEGRRVTEYNVRSGQAVASVELELPGERKIDLLALSQGADGTGVLACVHGLSLSAYAWPSMVSLYTIDAPLEHLPGWNDELSYRTIEFSPDARTLLLGTAPTASVEARAARTGELVGFSGFLGGRMGVPQSIAVAHDSSAAWFTYADGSRTVFRIDLSEDGDLPHLREDVDWGPVETGYAGDNPLASQRREIRHHGVDGATLDAYGPGRAPIVGPGGAALMFPPYNGGGVSVFDLRSGRSHFRLTPNGGSGYLRHTRSGHFDGIPRSPLTAGVPGESAQRTPWQALALHDPKRVEAALQGVLVYGTPSAVR